ncbi:MAG: hypothetical protein U5K54_14435 [Cytophagales bacterium]|nr:hypothetical protein [Cytophagales bacterium]
MRLGQLARKLAIRPSQIVDFLAARQIYLEEGSNAKLKDESVENIVRHFAPEKLQEIVVYLNSESEIEPIAKEPEVIIAKEEPVVEEVRTATPIAQSDLVEDKPEVIKAPKVELSGLKVLGKIELPEPKKKELPEPVSPDGQPIPEKERAPRRERKPQAQTTRETVQPRWKNTVAQQREKEARELEEKKRAVLAHQKERRRDNYFNKVKVGQPTKAVRLYEEQVEEISVKQEAQPKTLWGKFIKWLNT